MNHLCFPTYELYPVNPGGAGVLIAGGIRLLAEAGFRCTVLCDFPEDEVRSAQDLLSTEDLGPGEVLAVSVASFLPKRPERALEPESYYESKSEGFALALAELHRRDPLDLIEFPEYAGIGYATLQRRLASGYLTEVPIAVRTHGGLEFVDQAEGVKPTDPDRFRMYRMERLALRLADHVLTPSAAIGEWYREYYGLPSSRFLLAPPPLEKLLPVQPTQRGFVDPGHFLFYGKLQEVKGCDVLAQAAASVVGEQPDRNWRFTFVGRDTPCTAHGQMVSACLNPLIPERWKAAFEFVPYVHRSQLEELTRTAVAAIVPSKFETFCLAAHELRAIGLPLIVSDIPAFTEYFTEATGCLVFDGSANGLKRAILRMRDEPGLSEMLSQRPRPEYRPFVPVYRELIARGKRSERQTPIGRKVLLHELGTLKNA